MYRHILLPVDGSAASRHVASHAFELAQQLGAKVTVVTVIEDAGVPFVQYGMEPYVDLEAVSTEAIEAQREGADRMLHDICDTAPDGVDTDCEVLEAVGRRTGEIIADAADARGADLIVMGTHGHRGLSRVFLGSVADTVIRAANVPVTLVRYHQHDGNSDEDYA